MLPARVQRRPSRVARGHYSGEPGGFGGLVPGRLHRRVDQVARTIANRLYTSVVLRSLVREARQRARLTQAALGRRAGVPQSTIARIESGARTPSTDLVERLVRAAGFEIRVRLGEHDPGTASLLYQSLRRTPAERLADATRAARFVLRSRRQVQDGRRGRRDGSSE